VPRRSRDRQDRVAELLIQVERRFRDSPLEPIGDLLIAKLGEARDWAQKGHASPDAVEHMVAYTSSLLDLLPRTFGERYDFDVQILAALVEDFSQGVAQVSTSLVPTPSSVWGHQIVYTPSIDRRPSPSFELIHIPGDDDLNDIDLLEYPFACHELGHNFLVKRGDAFSGSFAQTLDDVIHGLARQTLALQGPAKKNVESTIEQARRYWTPTPDHYNWAHEIAVDVIALWTCGPAYLAALQDVLEHVKTNPYQLGQSHPPYEVRAKAMIEAANRLRWAYYTGDYQTLVDSWPKSAWSGELNNVYVACADPRLINASVAAALDACGALNLPLCTPATVASIREKLGRQELPDLGVEIIVAAWVQRGDLGEDRYVEWERAAVRTHLDRLTE
jgi:hypothetical protein